MAQINQLSAYDSPSGGDQLPIFSTGNGDARKIALSALAAWLADGALTGADIASFVRVAPVTVANLPSAVGKAGALAFVSDATSSTFHANPVGNGAQFVPVYSDGSIWRIG
jgi:hypothetical protein